MPEIDQIKQHCRWSLFIAPKCCDMWWHRNRPVYPEKYRKVKKTIDLIVVFLKVTYYALFSHCFSALYMFLILRVEKPKACVSRNSSLPQKTLHLKCLKPLVSSFALDSVTMSHHMSPYLTFAQLNTIFMEANWKLKTRLRQLETHWAVLAQACVSWPIKGDWISGRQETLFLSLQSMWTFL